MPSVHIAESHFGQLVEQEGSYSAAKERVKTLVKEDVDDDE